MEDFDIDSEAIKNIYQLCLVPKKFILFIANDNDNDDIILNKKKQ